MSTPPAPFNTTPNLPTSGEWFDEVDRETGKPGLRFKCTMCGNCCTGPEGYVNFSEDEGRAIAKRLKISVEEFNREYTKKTPSGPSLKEKQTQFGLDCIFLDREKVPGKAVCGIYEDRPAQCRTWPFWPWMLRGRREWERAKKTCPGIDTGPVIPPQKIRIQRANTPHDPDR